MFILVLLRKNHKIEKWYNTQYNKYYLLEDNEREIWQNIIAKANKGYNEWYNETHGNDLCGPWIVDIKPEETYLNYMRSQIADSEESFKSETRRIINVRIILIKNNATVHLYFGIVRTCIFWIRKFVVGIWYKHSLVTYYYK